MSHQVENFSKEKKYMKSNQVEMVNLKNTITALKKIMRGDQR